MWKISLIALCLVVSILTTSAVAQEARCVYPRLDQVDARVRARVTPSPNGFDYQYLLENGSAAKQSLIWFSVQAFTPEGKVPTQVSASGWEAVGPISGTAFYMWDMLGGSRGLPLGTSSVGLGFRNADLPTIVSFSAWGKADPPAFQEGQAPFSCEGDDPIQNSFRGATVGPKPPPREFVPVEFLNFLITLVHDSRQAGWIREEEEKRELLKILLKAKRRLEANEPAKAAKRIEKFLKEVKEESCRDFQCRKEKALTSEAFALLFFNGQFLSERLPTPPTEREDDEDD